MLEGHTDSVACVCVVEMGAGAGRGEVEGTVQRVVSGSGDNTLQAWDVERGEPVMVLELRRQPRPASAVVAAGHPH